MRSSFLLFSLLVTIAHTATAISTQMIEQGPLVDFASHEIMALDDAVLYLKKQGESEVIWSYNRSTSEKQSLFTAISFLLMLQQVKAD